MNGEEREHEARVQALMKPALDILPSYSTDTLSRTAAQTVGSSANIILRMVAEMLLPIVERMEYLDNRQDEERRKLEDRVDQQIRRLDGRG